MRAREYPDSPLVGVGVVIFNDKNNILLVQRGQEPSQGLWALPGGVVELGEELKTAAKREVKEECNIEVEVGEVVSVVDLILKDHNKKVKYHYILIDYHAKYIAGSILPQSDAKAVKWFCLNELEELDVPELTRQVITKAVKELKNKK